MFCLRSVGDAAAVWACGSGVKLTSNTSTSITSTKRSPGQRATGSFSKSGIEIGESISFGSGFSFSASCRYASSSRGTQPDRHRCNTTCSSCCGRR